MQLFSFRSQLERKSKNASTLAARSVVEQSERSNCHNVNRVSAKKNKLKKK